MLFIIVATRAVVAMSTIIHGIAFVLPQHACKQCSRRVRRQINVFILCLKNAI